MTVTDRTLDSIGLVRHPTPKVLAQQLRALAVLLENDGPQAIRVAPQLAARGWPGGTMGDGTGARTSDATSSVERAAGVTQDAKPADMKHGRHAGADARLARLLRLVWKTGLDIETLIVDLLAHGDDVDVIPAGTGECECCSRFVRPTADRPHDRLRSGLCDPCRKAWDKAGRPERRGWIIDRRRWLRDAVTSTGKAPAEVVELDQAASS